MREANLERVVADTISNTAIGEKVKIRFTGLAIPVEVMMRFAGGWEVGYTLIPGMPLEFVRGEEGYLEELSITLMPHDGLKQQV